MIFTACFTDLPHIQPKSEGAGTRDFDFSTAIYLSPLLTPRDISYKPSTPVRTPVNTLFAVGQATNLM